MTQANQHVISRGITINGTISGSGNLLVEGTVRGEIDLANAVTIEKTAKVEADIRADQLKVNGETNGNITASSLVSIGQGARVLGDIKAPRVAIEDGADFNGAIEMEVNLPEDV